MRAPLLIIFGISLAFSAQAAALYKWVDDKGKTHYGDKIPPEYSKLPSEKILPNGARKTESGEKTAAQISAERQLQEEAKAKAAREQEELRLAKEVYYKYENKDALLSEARKRDQYYADQIFELEQAAKQTEAKISRASKSGSRVQAVEQRELIGDYRKRRDHLIFEREKEAKHYDKVMSEWSEAEKVIQRMNAIR